MALEGVFLFFWNWKTNIKNNALLVFDGDESVIDVQLVHLFQSMEFDLLELVKLLLIELIFRLDDLPWHLQIRKTPENSVLFFGSRVDMRQQLGL